LISEALRGEGAKLKTMQGQSFMSQYHKDEELAPRNSVARAIDYQLKVSGDRYVLLDISHKPRSWLLNRFPNIYKQCLALGCDISKDPIPVIPAAHYFCGGLKVDANGQTTVANLYAIGEVSCTGLHGANRLASNSLLEGLAYADFSARHILSQSLSKVPLAEVRPWDSLNATNSDEAVVILNNWDEIRRVMWNYVGIVRTNKRLSRARSRIKIFLDEIQQYYWDFKLTQNLIELRNLALVADLTVRCALNRKESIGLHANLDYPHRNQSSRQFNVISPKVYT
jgi:L-aspartate oxidase